MEVSSSGFAGSDLSFWISGAAWVSAMSFSCAGFGGWGAAAGSWLTAAAAEGGTAGLGEAGWNPRIAHPPAVPTTRQRSPNKAVRSLVQRIREGGVVALICRLL